MAVFQPLYRNKGRRDIETIFSYSSFQVILSTPPSLKMICSSKVRKWVISVCSLLVELIQDANPSELFVDFTYIEGAAAKGAFCLDGTLPGYHFHPGHGSGANSWLVDLEGGGWCHDIQTCVERKTNGHGFGSSEYMNKSNAFNGILSNRSQDNPDFFNWNRARVRYCDGASFAGEGVNKAAGLQFRGQRIYRAAMDTLMSKGMRHANQALLSGCSAGGLAVILHCDHFSNLFPRTTRVKCLSDAGLFMDAIDISGRHSMRNLLFKGVVSLQGVKKILPHSCTSHLDATSCFFPQNLINYVRTPLFILNAAYDTSQIGLAVAPNASDPDGNWTNCKSNITECSQLQIHILQKFRKRMIKAVKSFGAASQNGVFINSCFTHCQAVFQVTWLSDNPPMVGNKGISVAVGDWYFGRPSVNKIDCRIRVTKLVSTIS